MPVEVGAETNGMAHMWAHLNSASPPINLIGILLPRITHALSTHTPHLHSALVVTPLSRYITFTYFILSSPLSMQT